MILEWLNTDKEIQDVIFKDQGKRNYKNIQIWGIKYIIKIIKYILPQRELKKKKKDEGPTRGECHKIHNWQGTHMWNRKLKKAICAGKWLEENKKG